MVKKLRCLLRTILPWQKLCEEKGAILKVIPINEHGELIISEYKRLLSDRTKIVSSLHAVVTCIGLHAEANWSAGTFNEKVCSSIA